MNRLIMSIKLKAILINQNKAIINKLLKKVIEDKALVVAAMIIEVSCETMSIDEQNKWNMR